MGIIVFRDIQHAQMMDQKRFFTKKAIIMETGGPNVNLNDYITFSLFLLSKIKHIVLNRRQLDVFKFLSTSEVEKVIP